MVEVQLDFSLMDNEVLWVSTMVSVGGEKTHMYMVYTPLQYACGMFLLTG
jgi:hypothetical protein